LNTWQITMAARAVKLGAVIAYPTEAVYGLGCAIWNREGIERILYLKGRDPAKGLIVIAASLEQLDALIEFPESGLSSEIRDSWPGPVSWVLPAKSTIPWLLKGDHSGLAVRIPGHESARELCQQAGPLISTSANPAGMLPARDIGRVRAYFGNQLGHIMPGSVNFAADPSQIRDAGSGEYLRT
jgi:L-threonylcarbamoyladenylate synthase